MKVIRKVLQFVLVFGSIATSFGEECDPRVLSHCFETLLYFDDLAFPYYGANETALDFTCSTLRESFDCLDSQIDLCQAWKGCGADCHERIVLMNEFSEDTGVRHLQNELCNPNSVLRHTYLENYDCLEKNRDHYIQCHNHSQRSQEYMHSLNATTLDDRCCFNTWFHDCFTNITRETCNENATFYISYISHILLNHAECGQNSIICHRPMLPPDNEDDEKSITSLDDGYPEINEVDNSLENTNGASASHTLSIRTFVATIFWLLLSKYVL